MSLQSRSQPPPLTAKLQEAQIQQLRLHGKQLPIQSRVQRTDYLLLQSDCCQRASPRILGATSSKTIKISETQGIRHCGAYR
mmetsp:Transcript_99527/g.172765  ORF Transcript_99527/g.172765 Transcript_99527/m.172765 type:complete len:82 (+) Transcript_99527:1372-1617(+)